MSDCICHTLGCPLDAIALDIWRVNAIVIHNRSQMLIDLCDVPHKTEPYGYYLCSPESSFVQAAIANKWFFVESRFDGREQLISDE